VNLANRRFFAAAAGIALLGIWLGFALSRLPKIAPYKLLNIAGIIYGLLGVVVLAELVMKSDALKRIMVTYVAGAVVWASLVVPLGMLLGAGFAYAAGMPSAASTASCSISFVVWSMLPLSTLDATVVAPTRLIKIGVHGRHQIFGLALLLCGGTLQLVAAVFDLVI
jgi:hypothetical protein